MDQDVRATIAKCLGKGINDPVPAGICTEFCDLFSEFPHDDKFQVQPGKNGGLGWLTCTEPDCSLNVPLVLSKRQGDGGAALGFGSFDSYKAHIREYAPHRKSRDARIGRTTGADAAGARRQANATATVARADANQQARANDRSRANVSVVIDIDSDEDVKPALFSPKRPANADYAYPADKRAHLGDNKAEIQRLAAVPDRKPVVAAPPPAVKENPTYHRMYLDASQKILDNEAIRNALPPAGSRTAAQQIMFSKSQTIHVANMNNIIKFIMKWGNPTPAMKEAAKAQVAAPVEGAIPAYGAVPALAPIPAAAAPRLDQMMPNLYAEGLAWAAGALMRAPPVAPPYPLAPGREDGGSSDNEYSGQFAGEDLNDFLKIAAEGNEFEGNATVEEARRKLGLKDQSECIPGMVVTLMPHQLIGVSWMVDQESNARNYGGILGDEMGLGKTVQTIALMCKNISTGDDHEKTNLIVAPLALLQQWQNEIENKCKNNLFKILIYHGPTKTAFLNACKAAKRRPVDGLAKYGVVLTTYSTLALEWPDEETLLKKAKKARAARRAKAGEPVGAADEDDPEFDSKPDGVLFQNAWYRIILDEAQCIRNRNTRISRAVTNLDSTFRWALTGTPITNSLSDVFPLLRFAQIKPWYTYPEFSSHVMVHEKRNPSLAGKKCQAILRQVMLRRKKDSKLDGKALITLPPKTVELRTLEFSPEEREIYSFVEKRTQATFNKFLKAGTVLKNYAHVLVLLLRLRQLTCHPSLITDGFDALAIEQAGVKEVERAIKIIGHEMVAKIKARRLEIAIARLKLEKEGPDGVDDSDGCPICMEPEGEGEGGGVVTKCGHCYCKPCFESVMEKPLPEADADEREGGQAPKYQDFERPCPNCRGPISHETTFNSAAFNPTDEELTAITGAPMEVEDEEDAKQVPMDEDAEEEDLPEASDILFKPRIKQNNTRVVQDSDDEEEPKPKMSETKAGKQKEVKKTKADEDNWMSHQEPSTKMKWLLEEIQRCAVEAPNDKFLVLCNFTTMLDLVSDYLTANGVRSTRYQGDMTRNQRDDSVKVLEKSKSVKVMLMSLKCGGVGLNLVRANRCVSLDLAWSTAVEQQAFDRIHRIGQTKDVFVDRLTINESVEQRIGDMQIRKAGLADAALGEGKGVKLGKLTVGDLAQLFGLHANGQRIAPPRRGRGAAAIPDGDDA